MPVTLELHGRPRFDTDTFRKELPTARIRSAGVNELPEKAIDLFDNRVSMRTHEHTPGDFGSFFAINHQEGGLTYVAQKKVTNDNGGALDWTYVFDVDAQGEFQGFGEMVHGSTSKPFVGYTYSEVKKQGFGKRRLEIMNALSSMLYNQPLHSGFTIEPAARSIWEKLVYEGLAESYMDGESQRYVFI